MNLHSLFVSCAGVLTLSLVELAPCAALDIELPEETASYTASDLPGYTLVRQNCLMCHSAEYVLNQPPTSSREYWDTIVRKMKHPFGAFYADADIPAMVDYLVKTYGIERPGAVKPVTAP